MSAKIAGAVWDLVLSPAKQTVLLALADHADHSGGNVKPGVPLIAWKTGYSERQVQRIMKILEADKLLIKVREMRGKPTLYRIDLSAGVQKEPYKARDTHDKMSPLTIRGVTSHESDESQGGDIASANLSSIRQSTEPSLKDSSPENGDGSATEVKASDDFTKSDRKERPRDPYFDAISAAWGITNGGVVSQYVGMLFSTKTVKGDWHACRITPPLTLEEFALWKVYADVRKVDLPDGKQQLPTSPITLARWVDDFRREAIVEPLTVPQVAVEKPREPALTPDEIAARQEQIRRDRRAFEEATANGG